MATRSSKQMQQVTEQPPKSETIIRITARTDVGYEHHLDLPESAVRALLDPEVPDAYIEVPLPSDVRGAKRRFLHTSRIAEIDLHDELPPENDDTPKPVAAKAKDINKGG